MLQENWDEKRLKNVEAIALQHNAYEQAKTLTEQSLHPWGAVLKHTYRRGRVRQRDGFPEGSHQVFGWAAAAGTLCYLLAGLRHSGSTEVKEKNSGNPSVYRSGMFRMSANITCFDTGWSPPVEVGRGDGDWRYQLNCLLKVHSKADDCGIGPGEQKRLLWPSNSRMYL